MMARKQRFNNFITENLDNVYRFAYTYVRNHQDAEDVVAESVEKALRKIDTLKNPDAMKTWFYKIIINTAINHIKKECKTISIEEAGFGDSENMVWDDYSEVHFNDMIKILSANDRAIIALRFFEERKFSEIAEILVMNENTVKTRLYGALKKLKLENEKGGQP